MEQINHNIDTSDSAVCTPRYDKMSLGEILTKMFDVSSKAIEEALLYQTAIKELAQENARAVSIQDYRLGEVLVSAGIVSRSKVYRALALKDGLEYMSAAQVRAVVNYRLFREPRIASCFDGSGDPKKGVSDLINRMFKCKSFISHYHKDESDEPVVVVVASSPECVKSVKMQITPSLERGNVKFKVVVSDNSSFDDFQLKFNAMTRDELAQLAKYVDRFNPVTQQTIDIGEFYQALLCYAIVENATDIHLFPSGNGLARIVLRKIGDLETQFYIRYELYKRIIDYTKRKAGGNMQSNVVEVPQDGRVDGTELLQNVEIRLGREDAIVDRGLGIDENLLKYSFPQVSFRISTYPTESQTKMEPGNTYEKLVIRVLNLSAGLTELPELGLSEQTVAELNDFKERTQGIIIIVGPTGSGKSTTLYSFTNSIDCLSKAVITFEDPVEMRQMLWAQGQRKPTNDAGTNFDFAQANKAILRQDPDIIMMAEVRDNDTAMFSINAANTGHLVMTTLHANSAASSIERLKKLGVDGLDIAISVLAVMGQRIIKKLCEHCRIKQPLTEAQRSRLLKLDLPESVMNSNTYVHVHNSSGECMYCGGRGYTGVTVINEIIPFTKEIKHLIVKNASEIEIREQANKDKWKTMVEDGYAKSVAGICDIEDVIKRL